MKKGYKTYLVKMKKQSKYTYCSTNKRVYIPKESKKIAEEIVLSSLEEKKSKEDFNDWFSELKTLEQVYDYICYVEKTK